MTRYDYAKKKYDIKKRNIYCLSILSTETLIFMTNYFHFVLNERIGFYQKKILTTEIEVDGGRHLSKFVLGFDLRKII